MITTFKYDDKRDKDSTWVDVDIDGVSLENLVDVLYYISDGKYYLERSTGDIEVASSQTNFNDYLVNKVLI